MSDKQPSKDLQSIGRFGEETAKDHLLNLGYSIIECNYRCRFGEMDIIADHDGVLVFVEVKTRTGSIFGTPAEAITVKKKERMSRTALEYLDKKRLSNKPARFDIVSISMRNNRVDKIEVLPNAFDLSYGF